MPSILLINPNTSVRSTEMMVSVARPLLPPGFTIRGACAARGSAMILDAAGLAVAEEEVVRIGTEEAGGADAVLVAAFSEPGARRLRALLPVPVVGIGEAAIREAAAGGRRFGIATVTPGLVGSIEGIVDELGLAAAFAGVRVPDCDPLRLAANPAAQDEALARAARECIALDGAEAVVIGGGPLSETAARLRQRFETAIVEPIPAAVRALLDRLAMVDPVLPT